MEIKYVLRSWRYYYPSPCGFTASDIFVYNQLGKKPNDFVETIFTHLSAFDILFYLHVGTPSRIRNKQEKIMFRLIRHFNSNAVIVTQLHNSTRWLVGAHYYVYNIVTCNYYTHAIPFKQIFYFTHNNYMHAQTLYMLSMVE